MIDSYAALLSCMAVVQASDSMTALTYVVGSGLMSVLDPSWFNKWFSLAVSYSGYVVSHEPSLFFHLTV